MLLKYMKKRMVWIFGIVIALIFCGLFLIFKHVTKAPQQPSQQNVSPFTGQQENTYTNNVQTSSSSTISHAPTMTVEDPRGGSIIVRDFTKDPAVLQDKNNPGHSYIAGDANSSLATTPFSIFYVGRDQSFTISLLQEPLRSNRLQAEQLLEEKLGISEASMCRLRYVVATPYQVSAVYGGINNLGFSFCPGATALP